MNNGIFVQNLIDKQSSDVGLPRPSLVNSDIVLMPYAYGGDEYWRYDPNKFVLLYDTRYSSNTTVTLPIGDGNTYNIVVDWGDGNINRYSGFAQNVSYTYKRHGVYLVQISGSLLAFGANFTNNNANKVIKCLSFGSSQINALYYTFDGCANIIEVPKTIPTGVTQLQACFRNCSKFNQDLSLWDVRKVTNFGSMFSNATNFNGNLSEWYPGADTAGTSCNSMFSNNISLKQDFSSWNVSKVTNMQYMFYGCTGLTNISISGWAAASGCTHFGQFAGANLSNSSLSNWTFSGNNSCYAMFGNPGANLTNTSGFDSWSTTGITNMDFMFYGATFTGSGIENWNTSNVTTMNQVFQNSSQFNGNISLWDVSKVTSMSTMFYITSFNRNIGSWNVTNVTNMGAMFGNSAFNNGGSPAINNWNTSNVTNMGNMFLNCSSFNQPLNNWNVRKVTTFASMFQGATNFNSSLSGWALGADTAGTSCLSMFQSATSFNQDISNWDTSKVTNMGNMFANQSTGSGFNQNIGSWNTSSVTNMSLMFYANYFFNNNNNNSINSWNTANVTDMNLMFFSAISFNQPIGNWNVSKVTNMTSMFTSAFAFNQDISNWNLAGLNASTRLDNFMNGKTGANSYSTANYDALLIGWNNNKLIGANGVANWRTDLRPNFGGAKYTAGGAAATARAALVSYGWTITDGGTA